MKQAIIYLLLSIMVVLGQASSCSSLKVAVVTSPVLAQSANDVQNSIEWALQNVSSNGKIAGRKVEVQYYNIAGSADAQGGDNAAQVAQSIVASGADVVIAATISDDMITLASPLQKAGMLVITPTATYSNLFRDFGNQSIWRTIPSDVDQTKVLLDIASDKYGAKKLGLVSSMPAGTPNNQTAALSPEANWGDAYGTSFFDWLGFFSIEDGLETTAPVRYIAPANSASCLQNLQCAVGLSPSCQYNGSTTLADGVIIAVQTVQDAECFLNQWETVNAQAKAQNGGKPIRFYMSASASPATLLNDMASAPAELWDNVVGVQFGDLPSSGFEEAYKTHFKVDSVSPYAAEVYDSILLMAYGLAQSKGAGGDSLNSALQQLVKNQGSQITWDKASEAMSAISSGQSPWVTGAASTLRYDVNSFTDLTNANYWYWAISNGAVQNLGAVTATSNSSGSDVTTSLSGSSAQVQPSFGAGSSGTLPAKQGDWAMVVAYSYGFENYRHQADALDIYTQLVNGGMKPEHIVFIYADDLANNPSNPFKGQVFSASNPTKNLYQANLNNYRLCIPSFNSSNVSTAGSEPNAAGETCSDVMTPQMLMNILGGTSQPGCLKEPCAVKSGPNDNIFVYFVGHGNQTGLAIGYGYPPSSVSNPFAFLGPDMLAAEFKNMNSNGKYRQVLMVTEACESGTMGSQLGSNTPNVALLTAARSNENSLSTSFNSSVGTFLGDQYTVAYGTCYAENSQESVVGAVLCTAADVVGSHPYAYNLENVVGLPTTDVDEFMAGN